MTTAAMKASNAVLGWTEQGLVPDSVIRAGIRRLCRRRLEEIGSRDPEQSAADLNRFVRQMDEAPVALVPERANEQHYEVPAAFFSEVLGHHRKYSCCFWDEGTQDLDQAEENALEITARRAGIVDGQSVLDLGCGWGSLSLWIARKFPACAITAVSNSASQRHYIEQQARSRRLENLEVITADMNDFDTSKRFDRVVSVEMFEHMRNYRELFRRIHGWLNPGGRFFMHVFCHRRSAYEFRDEGPSDWMSREFFSGGIMPSADLPLRFQGDLVIQDQYAWNGRHYQKTAEAWLRAMDARRETVLAILAQTYGEAEAGRWFQRWRIFFMSCAELFGLDEGNEWYVSHYCFSRAGDLPGGGQV